VDDQGGTADSEHVDPEMYRAEARKAIASFEMMLKNHSELGEQLDIGQMCNDALAQFDRVKPNWLSHSWARFKSVFSYLSYLTDGKRSGMGELYRKHMRTAESSRLKEACRQALDIADKIVAVADQRSDQLSGCKAVSMSQIEHLTYLQRRLERVTEAQYQRIGRADTPSQPADADGSGQPAEAEASPEKDSTQRLEDLSYDGFKERQVERMEIHHNEHVLDIIGSVLKSYVRIGRFIDEQYAEAAWMACQARKYRSFISMLSIELRYEKSLPGNNKMIGYARMLAEVMNRGAGERKLLAEGIPDEANDYEAMLKEFDERLERRSTVRNEHSKLSGRVANALEPHREEGEE
jgi:hypothetical protein